MPQLVPLLRDPDIARRRQVLDVLNAICIGASEAVPALVDALADDDPQVRRGAVWVLAAMGPKAKPAVPRLITLLRDPNNDRTDRRYAAYGLREIAPSDPNVVKAMIALLDDEDDILRDWAAFTLGHGPATAEITAALVRAFHGDGRHGYEWVCYSLGRCAPLDDRSLQAVQDTVAKAAHVFEAEIDLLRQAAPVIRDGDARLARVLKQQNEESPVQRVPAVYPVSVNGSPAAPIPTSSSVDEPRLPMRPRLVHKRTFDSAWVASLGRDGSAAGRAAGSRCGHLRPPGRRRDARRAGAERSWSCTRPGETAA